MLPNHPGRRPGRSPLIAAFLACCGTGLGAGVAAAQDAPYAPYAPYAPHAPPGTAPPVASVPGMAPRPSAQGGGRGASRAGGEEDGVEGGGNGGVNGASISQAESGGELHAPPPGPPTAADRLEAAVRSYHAGRHDIALAQLAALLGEQPLDPTVARDTRVYMGEIFLVDHNLAGAREAFESALQDAPDLVLDPFVHPPDVCAFFAAEKARLASSASALPPPLLPSLPVAGPSAPLLPLGIAQARQHRPAMSTLFGTTQVISCGLSAGLWGWLLVDRRYGDRDQPGIDPTTGKRLWERSTLESRRVAQLTATGGCYLSYGLGVLDASVAARHLDRQDPPQGRGAGRTSLTIGLSGRF